MPKQIISYWKVTRGVWNNKECKYENFSQTFYNKQIEMEITQGKHGPVLRFIGGPTGYESYYIEDLMKNSLREGTDFCICAGTINSWPECKVPWDEVFHFIQENI